MLLKATQEIRGIAFGKGGASPCTFGAREQRCERREAVLAP